MSNITVKSAANELQVSAATKKTQKALNQAGKEALEFLLGVLKDEEADKKQRMEAAKFLLDKNLSLNESLTKQSIQMMLVGNKTNPQVKELPSGKVMARADFTNVRKVDGVSYEGDLPEEDEPYDLSTFGEKDTL